MATEKEKDSSPAKEAASAPASGGGIKPFLPLILTLVLMPAVGWAMTQFVLVPRLQKALGAPASHTAESAGGQNEGAGEHGKEGAGEKSGGKQTVSLTKLLVNVSGTMGSRYLMVSVTIAGNGADFETRIKKKEAQLRDAAMTALSTKTITDLERPGARNLVRSELITGFNNILGGGTVQELFITEFAIQ